MRAIVQRVTRAAVTVDSREIAAIGPGALILLGVHTEDDDATADRMARKLVTLRCFEDADGRMNLDVEQAGGELLVVSQFTLYGDTGKGNRPGFGDAKPGPEAEPLVERVRAALGAQGGRFGAHMHVELVNDGPVTLLVEVSAGASRAELYSLG